MVGGLALLTAVAARFSIPLSPVPITLQTIPVLLSGLWLGSKKGYLAQVLYLFAGVVGLPVFEGGAFGLAHITGPTGGYLVAFPVCALVLGLFADRNWVSTVPRLIGALLLGNIVILAMGWMWLSLSMGAMPALQVGVLPFLLVSVAKSVICLVAMPDVWRSSRRVAATE